MKIAIVEGKRPSLMPEGPEIEKRILGHDADIKCYGVVDPKDYASVFGDVDAVITRPGMPFSKEMVESLKKAKAIVSLGVGYDHICMDAARQRNITVCNVPDYGTEEVADTTVAMILAHQRKIGLFRELSASAGAIDWDWRAQRPIVRVRDARAGIIGLGRIGTAVAMRLKAFGYAVTFYDPYLGRGVEKSLGVFRSHDPGELVSACDIVSIHTPLTAETSGMVDEDFLERMKPSGILINTARGGIFKGADILHKYLRGRVELRIGADVWPDEPPAGHPLLTAWRNREAWLGDRLIICPHAAFYSESAMKDIRAFAAAVVKTVLSGGEPYNVVGGTGKNG